MPNWSTHLPRAGALVLSVAVAAAAYGVYTGQSSTSVRATGESVAGLPDFSAKAGGGLQTDRGASPAQDRYAKRSAAASSKASAPPVGVPEIQAVAREVRRPEAAPVAPPPPTPGPGGDHPEGDNPGGDNALDRELQRVIDNEGPEAPKRPPVDVKPVVGDPSDDAPVDLIDDPAAPDTETPPEGPVTPPAAPEPPAPAPATPVTPATPAAPADPDSGLDDTAAGGLDQTDPGTPVDETDQTASTPPPAATAAPPPAQTPAQGACAPAAAPSASG